MSGTYRPWRDLAQRDHVVLLTMPLPAEVGGGAYVPHGSTAAIVLDPDLSQVQRRCVLTHELVHDERGGGCYAQFMPAAWDAVVSREEQLVDDIAVTRLVPPDELIRVCVELEMACTHVEPHHIAEHFHVTEAVAGRALELQDLRLQAAVARHDAHVAEDWECA